MTDGVVSQVARREIIDRMRRPAFWVMLAISCLAVIAIAVGPKLVADDGDSKPTEYRLAVLGLQPPYVKAAMDALNSKVGGHLVAKSVKLEADAISALVAGKYFAVIDRNSALIVTDQGGPAGELREQLRWARALADKGVSPDDTLEAARAAPPPVRVLAKTDPSTGAKNSTAMVANIVLFILLQMYGAWVMMGVIEEKTSRVIEVLLAAVPPRKLLVGKLVGIGAVVFFHATTLVTVGVISQLAMGSKVLEQLDPASLPAALAWMMLGYAFYSCVFAGAGATVSRVEESQSITFPLVLPVLVAYIMGFSVIFQGGEVPWLYHAMAYFPPTAPVAMAVLQITGRVETWEWVLSMGICVASVHFMARLAARVYEGSILHMGSRMPLRHALRARSFDG